jgi:hypothetical protein
MLLRRTRQSHSAVIVGAWIRMSAQPVRTFRLPFRRQPFPIGRDDQGREMVMQTRAS